MFTYSKRELVSRGVIVDKELERTKSCLAAETSMLVLGKFGLVRFEALFAKPETKPFGFFQIF